MKNTLLLFFSLLAMNYSYAQIEKIPYKFRAEIKEKYDNDTVAWKDQIAAWNSAQNGDYWQALYYWDLGHDTSNHIYDSNEADSLLNNYSKVNAVDFITKEAEKHDIVIINEAHHNSRHRRFTEQLLQGLYDKGYRHLGLEALSNKRPDEGLNERTYPKQNSGYYTKDPFFGNMIRTALKLGFHVFPYEDTTRANGKMREISQAQNIHEIMNQYPNEKFLIHCGFDHVLEGDFPFNKWEKAMAGRLKEYTGKDPLTINQVVYSEKSKPEFNPRLLKLFNPEESVVLVDKDEKPMKYRRQRLDKGYDAYADLIVLHPPSEILHGRPSWVFEGEKEYIRIEPNIINIGFPVMIMLFNENDDINRAVPIDIAEIENADQKVVLLAKYGKWRCRVFNRNNEEEIFEIKEAESFQSE